MGDVDGSIHDEPVLPVDNHTGKPLRVPSVACGAGKTALALFVWRAGHCGPGSVIVDPRAVLPVQNDRGAVHEIASSELACIPIVTAIAPALRSNEK